MDITVTMTHKEWEEQRRAEYEKGRLAGTRSTYTFFQSMVENPHGTIMWEGSLDEGQKNAVHKIVRALQAQNVKFGRIK